MKKSQSIMDSMVPFHLHSEFLSNLGYISISLILAFVVIEAILVINSFKNNS